MLKRFVLESCSAIVKVSFVLALLAAILSLIGLLAGLTPFEGLNWICELINQLRFKYAVVLLAGLGIVLLGGRITGPPSKAWKLGFGLMLAATLVNVVFLLPYYGPKKVASESFVILKLLEINLGSISDFKPLLQTIQAEQPDVVCVVENAEPFDQLMPTSAYPHRFVLLNHQLGIYSKLPLRQSKVQFDTASEGTSVSSRITLQNRPVTLILSHPVNPSSADSYLRQIRHFKRWQREFASYGPSPVLVGDLNAVPWSRHFRDLLGSTGLRDSQQGFGLQQSWQNSDPLFSIAIDHILVSRKLVVLDPHLGPDVGSDHWPVVATLAVQP